MLHVMCHLCRYSAHIIILYAHTCTVIYLQSYEHKLADDMVDRCKAFVDESFPGDLWYQSHASYLKLRTLAIASENKDDAIHIANVVLGQVAQVKERFPIERVPVAFLYFEVTAWESLALFAESDDTKEGMKQAIEYHTKCCDVYKLIGIPTDIAHAEANIVRAKAKYSGDKSIWTPEDLIKDCLDYWNESIAESGEESSVSLISLFRYAEALKGAKLTIQSERMLLKLIAMANRVHGEKHDFTQDAKSTLERYRRRYVFVRGHRGSHFQALRYEDNERKVVVQGPIAKPRNMEEETQMTVHVDMQRPALGVPVKMYGLEGDESHLNGKIANVKSREKGARKYLVHFIEKGLEPCLIGPRNMKIMFQLPREVLEDWE